MKARLLALVAAVVSLTACGAAQHKDGTSRTSSAPKASQEQVSLSSCFASPAGAGTEAVVQFPPPATKGVATWKAEVSFGGHTVTTDNARGSLAYPTSYIDSSTGGALPCRLLQASQRENGVWQKAQGPGAVLRPSAG